IWLQSSDVFTGFLIYVGRSRTTWAALWRRGARSWRYSGRAMGSRRGRRWRRPRARRRARGRCRRLTRSRCAPSNIDGVDAPALIRATRITGHPPTQFEIQNEWKVDNGCDEAPRVATPSLTTSNWATRSVLIVRL